MSQTLGEKLRQAREERGFSLAEVAEQTRISSLYLESIENDDYRILPGGIFNKGFVKSYAKFVGINEQEALADYSLLISQAQPVQEEEFKTYRPEVLTDDRSGSSAPTIILAVVILAAMTAGILFLVNYLRAPSDNVATADQRNAQSTPVPVESATPAPNPADVPDMSSIKVDFKATSEAVAITAVSDEKKTNTILPAGGSVSFEPKQSLRISYSKSLANFVQLSINGKDIKLPSQPLTPKRVAIEVEINKDNLPTIWRNASFLPEASADEPAANTALPANVANTAAVPAPTTAPVTRTTPAPRPTAAPNTPAANVNRPVTRPTVAAKPTPAAPRPAATRPPE
jgi:cytoskeleton protein RodZ